MSGRGSTARPRAVLVRHGETEWSRSGRHTARTDLDLTPEGERQSEAVARQLAGRRFSAVLVSPRRRALQTVGLLGLADRAEVVDDLAEWDYGAYEGRTGDDIRAERPGWVLWFDGAPEGETASQVAERADRVIARVLEVDGDVLIVSHGHFLRALTARWLGEPVAGGRLFRLATGTVGVLGWEHGRRAVEVWNCGAHW
jgi:broad specificity phosphatase PhoE